MDEVITDWTTPSGGGKVTVHYVASVSTPAYRTAWSNLLTAMKPFIANTVSYTVRSEGRQIDSATGALTGSWGAGAPISGVGGSANQALPDSTQALIRWRTPTVVNGRFAQGRTYVPGFENTRLAAGNLRQVDVDALNTSLATFLAATPNLLIWSRPRNGLPGTNSLVTSGKMWNEYAVLRRRRG